MYYHSVTYFSPNVIERDEPLSETTGDTLACGDDRKKSPKVYHKFNKSSSPELMGQCYELLTKHYITRTELN